MTTERLPRTSLALALGLVSAGCGDNLSRLSDGREGAAPTGDVPLACVPDLDGRITARELAPRLGEAAGYVVSPPGETRSVDLEGTLDAEGRRRWSFPMSASDRAASLEVNALGSQWYAPAFPRGGFVAPLDVDAELVGIYSHEEDALLVHGVASREAMPTTGKTLLIYATPVPLYRFPLEVGASWTATGAVTNGTLRGLPYAGEDTYEVKDDASGIVVLPEVVFTQVHRVRTTVRLAPSVGAAVTTRQV
ncbi:MAG: hypothetical protein FJ096_22175, partial [Deltaproteobacteria bacterium]|nr:hypothetical protein [Deltaproteobacteria bacterium]